MGGLPQVGLLVARVYCGTETADFASGGVGRTVEDLTTLSRPENASS